MHDQKLEADRDEKCKDCGNKAHYHGMNTFEYLCTSCRQEKRDAYDNYVDPLGAYH